MQLGRVIGTVVATVKTAGLEGIKFLIVQPLDVTEHRIVSVDIDRNDVVVLDIEDVVSAVGLGPPGLDGDDS